MREELIEILAQAVYWRCLNVEKLKLRLSFLFNEGEIEKIKLRAQEIERTEDFGCLENESQPDFLQKQIANYTNKIYEGC